MSKKNDTTIHCTLRADDDGVVAYVDPNGVDLALKMPWCGTVADIRPAPPFYAMSPCPYCGAHNDRGHDPMRHTDPMLGWPSRLHDLYSLEDTCLVGAGKKPR